MAMRILSKSIFTRKSCAEGYVCAGGGAASSCYLHAIFSAEFRLFLTRKILKIRSVEVILTIILRNATKIGSEKIVKDFEKI